MQIEDVALVIVSYNTREHLERCLQKVVGRGLIVVVDNASTDGSAELVRARFPDVRLIELPENVGFGAAANNGIEATTSHYVLLLNPDAWPAEDHDLESLVACAERHPDAGVLGPRLVGIDGSPQPSLVGRPTRWWTGTPAITTVAPGPLGRLALRAGRRGAFLVGAVLLLRREALEAVGGFDPDFFMFGEEVDLCLRLQSQGWSVLRCAEAVFVHAGGAATRAVWPSMYREQVRSHLRLLAKHDGPATAEAARRYLTMVLRVRALLAAPERRALYRDAATWLASAEAMAFLGPPDRTLPGRSAGAEGRTTRSGG